MSAVTPLYRLTLRDALDVTDLLVVESDPSGTNPYISEPPRSDGQTLDLVTGRTTIGQSTIKVLDKVGAFSGPELLASDGLNYASIAALEAAGWAKVETSSWGTWSMESTVVREGARSLEFDMLAGANSGGDPGTDNQYYERTFTGLPASTIVTVRCRVWQNVEGFEGIKVGVRVDGVDDPAGYYENAPDVFDPVFAAGNGSVVTFNDWVEVDVTGRTTAGGALTVQLGVWRANTDTTRLIRFDDLRIFGAGGDGTGLIVTSILTDAAGRPQVIGNRATIEESVDEGTTWNVIQAGYVNKLSLVNAVEWEFTVGDTQRAESRAQVFAEYTDDFPEVSYIFGGPIRIFFNGYQPPTRNRPTFRVEAVESEYVRLDYVRGPVPPYRPSPNLERGRRTREIVNRQVRPYYVPQGAAGNVFAPLEIPSFGAVSTYSSFPRLRVRVFIAGSDTLVGTYEPIAVYGDIGAEGDDDFDWGVWDASYNIHLKWTTSQPSIGTRYDIEMYPLDISERNPLHLREHPIDLVTKLWDALGIVYDAASATSVRTELGDGLRLELRITGPRNVKAFLDEVVFAPFGVAWRLNDDGERELFNARAFSNVAADQTVTLDYLRSDEGNVYELDDNEAIAGVQVEQLAYGQIPPAAQNDEGTPGDFIEARRRTITVDSDDAVVVAQGVRRANYTIPGRLVTSGGILVDDVTYWGAVANELLRIFARGVPTIGLKATRAFRAAIGEDVIIALPHYPGADPQATPTSQRGIRRRARVLRKSYTPAGPDVLLADLAQADTEGTVPTFTIDLDGSDPQRYAVVTITNAVTLAAEGALVRVEVNVGTSTPTSGTTAGILDPASTTTLRLGPFAPGTRVWARARAEIPGYAPSAWAAFDNVDLNGITAPSGLAVGAGADETQRVLTWTNGDATYAVQVLLRLSGETNLQPIAVLPPGSTSYVLTGLTTALTGYVVGVRHVTAEGDAASATDTESFTTANVAVNLDPPVNPVAFVGTVSSGGSVVVDGTFGLQVDATEFPSNVEFEVAVETGIGTGTPGTYQLVASVTSVAGAPTRFRAGAPNDGLLRFIRARHAREGAVASSYTTAVSVNPWEFLAVPPVFSSLILEVDGSGDVVARYVHNGLSLKIAGDTAGYPTDGTVQAETAINGSNGTTGTLVTLAEGERAYVKAFAYSNVNGGGTESAAATATILRSAGAPTLAGSIMVVIDGGGSAIPTGLVDGLAVEIPFALTLTGYTALADQSGSIVVDVWRDSYANYEPTDADSITASAPITLTAAAKAQDNTLTGWDTTLAEGDILMFNVDSAATITRLTIFLRYTRD